MTYSFRVCSASLLFKLGKNAMICFMIEVKDIKKLAELSRLQMTETEMADFAEEFDSILNYVAQVKNVVGELGERTAGELRNVMRGDDKPNVRGAKTEVLTQEFPTREGNYLKVKKIL